MTPEVGDVVWWTATHWPEGPEGAVGLLPRPVRRCGEVQSVDPFAESVQVLCTRARDPFCPPEEERTLLELPKGLWSSTRDERRIPAMRRPATGRGWWGKARRS